MASWKKMDGTAKRDAQRRWRIKKKLHNDFPVLSRNEYWVRRRLDNLMKLGVIEVDLEEKSI